MGGVHVNSMRYGVAAIGNVATGPQHRGHGHATRVAAAIVRDLSGAGIELMGLNVQADNVAAVRCYERLDFRSVCRYLEGRFSRKSLA